MRETGAVLFVLEWYPPHVGGVETLFRNLAATLAARGWEVHVVTSLVRGAPRREVLDGVHVHRVRVPHVGARYVFTLAGILAALRLARRVDLVHTTTYNAAIPGWVAARLTRRPVVLTVHEVWAEQWNGMPGMNRWIGWGYRAFERFVLKLPMDAYICVSRYTLRRLLEKMRAPEPRCHVVEPAVDYGLWGGAVVPAQLKHAMGVTPETFVYLSFGRPGVSKGLEYLIDAAKRVRCELPDSRLVMILAHDPPLQYGRLVDRIRENQLEGYVVLRDPVGRAELPSMLQAADCVVVPSLSEGFGYTAAEAAVLGRPLVATSGHAVETVVDGAVLVPPGDADALASAILRVAADGDAKGASTRERFDVDRNATLTEAVYSKLLA